MEEEFPVLYTGLLETSALFPPPVNRRRRLYSPVTGLYKICQSPHYDLTPHLDRNEVPLYANERNPICDFRNCLADILRAHGP